MPGEVPPPRSGKVYRAWNGMRVRCTNVNCAEYYRYGGRGISVCPRWKSYENLYRDMGPPPSSDHQIDRIDNDGNYKPGNCRWATRRQQAQNRSTNTIVTHRGETRCVEEWCRTAGISSKTFHDRIWAGWSFEKAIETPVDKIRRNRAKKSYHAPTS